MGTDPEGEAAAPSSPAAAISGGEGWELPSLRRLSRAGLLLPQRSLRRAPPNPVPARGGPPALLQDKETLHPPAATPQQVPPHSTSRHTIIISCF